MSNHNQQLKTEALPRRHRPLVLLVDDEPTNLQLLVEALRSDYEVAVATDGATALQLSNAPDKPSIILLDVMMPGMDGYEVCRRLKADANTKDIPVIFITAAVDEESEERGFDLGAADYIHKPFKLQLVRARVRTHLSLQGMMDELLGVNSRLNEAISLYSEELKNTETCQQLFARVFASTAEGIIVTDPNGNIQAVNRAFTRITGYTEAEALGKNPRLLKSGHHSPDFYRDLWRRLVDTGHWNGELFNRRKNGEIYPEMQSISAVFDRENKLTNYVAVFSDISSIKETQERMDFLTWHDPLTGLPNRLLFTDRLGQTLSVCNRDNRHSAALVLDVDRFKSINDGQGLLTGDAVLVEIGQRLRTELQDGDTLARLAADEYAIVLSDLHEDRESAAREALIVAEKALDALARPYHHAGNVFQLTCSIGVAMFPEHGEESATIILRNAETARHRAALEGGNRVVFFEEAMGVQARQRFLVEQQLRKAVDQGELRMYLQSQVNSTGKVVGAESLVRWQHPQRGLIPPNDFIPLAEESDLIVRVDKWMLRQVCGLLQKLSRGGEQLRISTNISARHFRQENFVREIKELMQEFGIPPGLLVLEVTERLMIQDVNDVVAKMTSLNESGIRFSIDDFGTGYSSLAYLKRLPIHEVKIDKSFILEAPVNSSDADMVEIIHMLADTLKLESVAEGVETENHAAFLRKYPYILQQGYFYGKPMAAAAWVKQCVTATAP